MPFTSDYMQQRSIQQSRMQPIVSKDFVRLEANGPPPMDSPLRYSGQSAPARRIGTASAMPQGLNRRLAQQTPADRRYLVQRPATINVNHSRTADVSMRTMEAPSASPIIGSAYTTAAARPLARQQAASAQALMDRAQARLGHYENQRMAAAVAAARSAEAKRRMVRPELVDTSTTQRPPSMPIRAVARPKTITTSHTRINTDTNEAASLRAAPSQPASMPDGLVRTMDVCRSRDLIERLGGMIYAPMGDSVVQPGQRLKLQPATQSANPGFELRDDQSIVIDVPGLYRVDMRADVQEADARMGLYIGDEPISGGKRAASSSNHVLTGSTVIDLNEMSAFALLSLRNMGDAPVTCVVNGCAGGTFVAVYRVR